MKKIISIITIAVLLMAMTVTALAAFPSPSANKEAWLEANAFIPVTFKAGKATGTINIDGAATAEAAYGSAQTIKVEAYSEEQLLETGGAIGEAKVAWDSDSLYIHFNVKDTTKKTGFSYDTDSVEIYLDYDQKADGKKVMWNKVSSGHTHIAQYRIQRGGSTLDAGVVGNDTMMELMERAKVKVVENGTAGYVVEAKIPLKDKSGKYIPVSDTIGFELQINDSKNGTERFSAAYIQGGLQYYAYEYSSLFDNIKLDGASDVKWSTRTVKTDINENLRDFDPNSVYVPKPTSTKPSSTASKVSTAPATSSTVSEVESTVSTNDVSSVEADTPSETDPKGDEDTDTDADKDDTTNTIGAEENKGGLSTPILIAIIAGSVLVLAAAGVAVFFIIKKRKAQ